ncbi:hypothetical protein KJ359_005811 [Pestalotiopsis sp. 9143b]|nr:hypothetical protein KJ359_005811 [Pestalotiopsis sp. 9143b]
MAAVAGAVAGQPSRNPSRQVYEFALRKACSDGRLWPEEQYKAAERLSPDTSEADKRKHQEFLLKLGGLIRDQFLVHDPVARGRNYILKELPGNYHIRKKLKTKADKDKQEKYDYFIYGHPASDRSGNPRSYATANEFFHHLIYLIGDSHDTGHCACKLCNKSAKHEPEALKKRIAAASAPASAHGSPAATVASPALQAASMRRTASASSVSKAQAPQRSAAQPQQTAAAQPKQQQQKHVTPVPVPVQPAAVAAAAATAARNPTPVPAPAPAPIQAPIQTSMPAAVSSTSTQAQVETKPAALDNDIFRVGEIVWYKNNNAWRLGIVIASNPPDALGPSQPRYLIKPLAHSAMQLENVFKAELDMRPYLAFSVPPVNMGELGGQRMNQINWLQLQSQNAGNRQKQEAIGLEASKLAALEISGSYSTFNNQPMTDPTRQNVGGVFLGAECIRVGEAVRYRPLPNEINPAWAPGLPIVMLIREIYLATSGLHFVGDIFRLEETAAQQPKPDVGPLTATMLREQQFRSQVRRTHFEWALISQNQDRDETSIRGRFYEAAKLLPIINPGNFQAGVERGIVEDVQGYLNNRLDSLSTNMGRRVNRLETLSSAVPQGFSLNLGPGISE